MRAAASPRLRIRIPGKAGRRLAAACMAAAGLRCGDAAADQLDTLNVVVGAKVNHESNVLRVPASANPTGDTIKVVYAGLRLDKSYSLQRFQLDYIDTRSRFTKLRERNTDTIDYQGAWLWSLTPRISGTLEAKQTQALVEADESQGTARNLRTTNTRNFSLDGSVFGGWHLLLGANQKKQLSEAPVFTSADFQSVGGQAGAKYEATSGSSVTVNRYWRQGDYINREFDPATLSDNRYYENESELKLAWKASGRSVLTGRLAWLARRHEHFAQRDFSGPVGELGYNWTATGRLTVDVFTKQSISATSEPFSSYRVDKILSITPKLQMTDKVSLDLRFDYSIADYRGPVVTPPGPLRRDVLRNAIVTVKWDISRVASVRANLQRQLRTSNDPSFGFASTSVGASADLTF